MPRQGRPDGSGLCDDEGDVAQYLGMDAFFNLKQGEALNAREQAHSAPRRQKSSCAEV